MMIKRFTDLKTIRQTKQWFLGCTWKLNKNQHLMSESLCHKIDCSSISWETNDLWLIPRLKQIKVQRIFIIFWRSVISTGTNAIIVCSWSKLCIKHVAKCCIKEQYVAYQIRTLGADVIDSRYKYKMMHSFSSVLYKGFWRRHQSTSMLKYDILMMWSQIIWFHNTYQKPSA